MKKVILKLTLKIFHSPGGTFGQWTCIAHLYANDMLGTIAKWTGWPGESAASRTTYTSVICNNY